MRQSLPLVLLLAGAGCNKPSSPVLSAPADAGPAEDPRLGWASYSAAGAQARQVGRAAGDCTVSCTPVAGAGWALPGCVAKQTDFRFVADDCGQVVILYEYPEIEGAHADVVVGTVVSVGAAPVPLRLGKFLHSSSKLRINGRHLSWLAGVLGVPGDKPRLSADGAGIEFVTIDQVRHAFTFAALGAWVDEGPRGAALAPGLKGDLYRWVDGKGSIQVGTRDQVPEKYRGQAVPLPADTSAR